MPYRVPVYPCFLLEITARHAGVNPEGQQTLAYAHFPVLAEALKTIDQLSAPHAPMPFCIPRADFLPAFAADNAGKLEALV
jgi:hypothetical protein